MHPLCGGTGGAEVRHNVNHTRHWAGAFECRPRMLEETTESLKLLRIQEALLIYLLNYDKLLHPHPAAKTKDPV